jgi:hypothetical protein
VLRIPYGSYVSINTLCAEHLAEYIETERFLRAKALEAKA